MKKVLTILLLAGVFTSCGNTQTEKTSEKTEDVNAQTQTEETTKTMNHKETVGKFLNAVFTQDTVTVRELANANYIQHNPFVPTGLEPFLEIVPALIENKTTPENIRMFQDGNYVFMHNRWHNAKPSNFLK